MFKMTDLQIPNEANLGMYIKQNNLGTQSTLSIHEVTSLRMRKMACSDAK
jgi:hypothetical protein